jgi:hypothetical protein
MNMIVRREEAAGCIRQKLSGAVWRWKAVAGIELCVEILAWAQEKQWLAMPSAPLRKPDKLLTHPDSNDDAQQTLEPTTRSAAAKATLCVSRSTASCSKSFSRIYNERSGRCNEFKDVGCMVRQKVALFSDFSISLSLTVSEDLLSAGRRLRESQEKSRALWQPRTLHMLC